MSKRQRSTEESRDARKRSRTPENDGSPSSVADIQNAILLMDLSKRRKQDTQPNTYNNNWREELDINRRNREALKGVSIHTYKTLITQLAPIYLHMNRFRTLLNDIEGEPESLYNEQMAKILGRMIEEVDTKVLRVLHEFDSARNEGDNYSMRGVNQMMIARIPYMQDLVYRLMNQLNQWTPRAQNPWSPQKNEKFRSMFDKYLHEATAQIKVVKEILDRMNPPTLVRGFSKRKRVIPRLKF